ncbi:MAG: EAL domain-containing protein [Ruminococcus sp.]|nr:EAL domain-containing protein [Ruminococcus sp.]
MRRMHFRLREIGVFALPVILTGLVIYLFIVLPDLRVEFLTSYAVVMIPSVFLMIRYGFEWRKRIVQKTLEKFTRIADSINAPVILWDADFHYIHTNVEFFKVFGYNEEDLKDDDILRRVLPPDAFAQSLQAIINNHDERFEAVAVNGSIVTIIWNTSMMDVVTMNKKTMYFLMSIGYDMTELLETRDWLDSSTRLAEIGIILIAPTDEKAVVNDQLREMVLLPDEEITMEDLKKTVHRKEEALIDTLITQMKGGAKHNADTVHTLELRMRSNIDSSYRWFQFRYRYITSPNTTRLGIGGSIIDISRDKEKDVLIERMAFIDDLTGIFNRNRFMQLGQEAFECMGYNDETGTVDIDYWVIITDIDNFHIINDTAGYQNGNKLLQRMASIMTAQIKNGGFTARIGGDNFALMIKDTGSDDVPLNVISIIQNQLRDIKSDTFKTQTITCSVGYCKMSDSKVDFSKVLDQAEFSLSLSDGTRESVIRYDNKVHETVLRAAEIEKELEEAIENGEFVLYYQPKISLEDGSLMGMEALIRWIKPDGRIVPPVQFIPVAEHSLLITKISEFVLYEACRQNKQWQDMGYPPVTVSVNLTSVDFYQTDVCENIKNTLAKTGLDSKWLDIELTESLALKDIDNAVAQMEQIRSLGIKLSMDDFGTGYSSLSYIQVLPISILKLDRSFIMYLEDDAISREIVSAVIRIAKSKEIEVIAEGVETDKQATILHKSGCDYIQGYLFGKPMSAKDFEAFMARQQTEDRIRIADYVAVA